MSARINSVLQVVVANTKREGSTRDPREDEKLVRLFVIVPKSFTEENLKEEFEVRIPSYFLYLGCFVLAII